MVRVAAVLVDAATCTLVGCGFEVIRVRPTVNPLEPHARSVGLYRHVCTPLLFMIITSLSPTLYPHKVLGLGSPSMGMVGIVLCARKYIPFWAARDSTRGQVIEGEARRCFCLLLEYQRQREEEYVYLALCQTVCCKRIRDCDRV